MLSVLLLLNAVSTVSGSPGAPFRLRLEYMLNPEGVDVAYKPRLSWALCESTYESRIDNNLLYCSCAHEH